MNVFVVSLFEHVTNIVTNLVDLRIMHRRHASATTTSYPPDESRYSLSQDVQYDSRVVLLIADVVAGRLTRGNLARDH
jgi:hypothetical protein